MGRCGSPALFNGLVNKAATLTRYVYAFALFLISDFQCE